MRLSCDFKKLLKFSKDQGEERERERNLCSFKRDPLERKRISKPIYIYIYIYTII